ncbi:phiSA1p31-related protein [Streptomyces sp. NPDC058657]|uniref:phiSA1p31-related protein n=1 Tax=unclassified Streptomyces TaxID=2593676 RepID=UPI00365CA228
MKIKFVDLDEHALVITVTTAGVLEVRHSDGCLGAVAEALMHVADQLAASHPPHPCNPAAGTEQNHSDEPLRTEHSSLDADRVVWTDGTGHRWDLSVTWAAAGTEALWAWSGQLDKIGTPMMQALDAAGPRVPLDVLRTLYGPISPATGENSGGAL